MLERSDLSRARGRWRSGSSAAPRDPLDYVKSVEAYLGRGFTYTEAPPAKSRTLEGFLFETKSGYCQQYSGAMALLLRMGGIPARVATGFTSGSYDRKAKEYVVRDLDAHSWVEAWFPDYGWVTFDPTPSAAPPRSQSSDRGTAAIGDAPDLGGGALDPRTGLAAEETHAVGALRRPRRCSARCCSAAACSRSCTAAAGRPRCPSSSARCGAPAAAPARARRCRRSRRRSPARPTPRATCARCATSATAAAASRPTSAQRRGLRSELGRGGGLRGRLRAWWALPPRRAKSARTIDAHG